METQYRAKTLKSIIVALIGEGRYPEALLLVDALSPNEKIELTEALNAHYETLPAAMKGLLKPEGV